VLSINGDRTSGQDVRSQNGASRKFSFNFVRADPSVPLPRENRKFPCLLFSSLRRVSPPRYTLAVLAVAAVANIVKSSLGPVGLDKMLVDDSGEVIITNDGATILRQLNVEHPAGRVCARAIIADFHRGVVSVLVCAGALH
jgi:hypothetical protein